MQQPSGGRGSSGGGGGAGSSFATALAAATHPSSFLPAEPRGVPPPLPRPADRPQGAAPASAVASAQRPAKAGRLTTIVCSPSQSGNPLLKELSDCSVTHDAKIVEDFRLSDTCSALYLSIKYHKLNPDYIGRRMEAMKHKVKTQLLVVLVDDSDCEKTLLDIQTLAFAFKFVVVLAWSLQECAKYLESYAKYSVSSAMDIKHLEGKQASDSHAKIVEVLTTIPSINKTDAKVLMRNFDNLADVFSAQMGDLSILSGFGDKKLQEFQALSAPFFKKDA